VQAYFNCDQGALGALVDRYWRRAYQAARGKGLNQQQAQDAAQEVFLELARQKAATLRE
jgi:DNA-directed RNA polymerase specialized sigma24 family protein